MNDVDNTNVEFPERHAAASDMMSVLGFSYQDVMQLTEESFAWYRNYVAWHRDNVVAMSDETGERDDDCCDHASGGGCGHCGEAKPAIKPCTCDIKTVLMVTGCVCGAMESERA